MTTSTHLDSLGRTLPPRNTMGLSERQAQVLRLMLDGASTKQMATDLNISQATVKVHVCHVLQAFGVSNRYQLSVAVTDRLGMPRLSTYVDAPPVANTRRVQ